MVEIYGKSRRCLICTSSQDFKYKRRNVFVCLTNIYLNKKEVPE